MAWDTPLEKVITQADKYFTLIKYKDIQITALMIVYKQLVK